jgi:hypothetical protein
VHPKTPALNHRQGSQNALFNAKKFTAVLNNLKSSSLFWLKPSRCAVTMPHMLIMESTIAVLNFTADVRETYAHFVEIPTALF